jgi:hypothetical protein
MQNMNSIKKCLCKIKIPNKKTLRSIANIEARKNLIRAKDIKDFFKKLGI